MKKKSFIVKKANLKHVRPWIRIYPRIYLKKFGKHTHTHCEATGSSGGSNNKL